METWLDVRPLRIPRPKLSGASSLQPKESVSEDPLHQETPAPTEVAAETHATGGPCAAKT